MVMVVEDDVPVLRLTERMLHEAGYRVISTESAEVALPLLDEHPQVRLLLTDVVLPGMSGIQLADRAMQTRPSLKVLYMTGYSDDGLGAVAAKAVEAQLVRKPFTAGQLVSKVRSALGAEEVSVPEPMPRD
jgi:DNA-binding NtrC family response regulator